MQKFKRTVSFLYVLCRYFEMFPFRNKKFYKSVYHKWKKKITTNLVLLKYIIDFTVAK